MWRDGAPRLAPRFTVVCADLRGYGRSGCPVSTPDHAPYTMRAMAADLVAVMERLGFARFSAAGHDPGGHVAYRMAIDHPDRVDRLAVLDVLPTETVWERADARFALGFWPWSLLALWRAWGDDVRGRAVRAGHFFPEEAPEQTAEALKSFFGGA